MRRRSTQVYADYSKASIAICLGNIPPQGGYPRPQAATPGRFRSWRHKKQEGEKLCGVAGPLVRWLFQVFRPWSRPPWPSGGPWRAEWKGEKRESWIPQVGSGRDFTPGYWLAAAYCVLLTAYSSLSPRGQRRWSSFSSQRWGRKKRSFMWEVSVRAMRRRSTPRAIPAAGGIP